MINNIRRRQLIAHAEDRYGFSLIELSIVLVVLGLLVGGILGGKALIRASELRAITTEHSKFISAIAAFRTQYIALPGDLNSTRFWAGTISGDENGLLDGNFCDDEQYLNGEPRSVWQHLSKAGLIEGEYTVIDSVMQVLGPATSPASKMNNVYWAVYSDSDTGNCSNPTEDGIGFRSDTYFPASYGNFLVVGSPGYDTANRYLPQNATLKPDEAYNIDTKMDDGRPARGKVIATGNIPNCTTGADTSAVDPDYLLDSNAIACILAFPESF